jgi:hypothetical protein
LEAKRQIEVFTGVNFFTSVNTFCTPLKKRQTEDFTSVKKLTLVKQRQTEDFTAVGFPTPVKKRQTEDSATVGKPTVAKFFFTKKMSFAFFFQRINNFAL